MSFFDRNQWYQITVPNTPEKCLVGLELNPGNKDSAAFFQITNLTHPAHQWQIYGLENDSFVLRTRLSGPTGYFSIKTDPTKTLEDGYTGGIIRHATNAGEEALWKLKSMEKGGYALMTVANGSDWRLYAKEKGGTALTNNTQGGADNQRFSFTRLGRIDDEAYSTLQTPAKATTTSPSSPPETSPPITSNTPNPSSPSSGLPGSTKIALAACLGGIGLIAIIAGVYFFLRRRRRRQQTTYDHPLMKTESETVSINPRANQAPVIYKHEMDTSHGIMELEQGHYRQAVPELAGQSAIARGVNPVELDSSQQNWRY